ncbi:MAG: YeeE/YedE thiosulfate transporter family protein [Gemmatimonadota bacterium]
MRRGPRPYADPYLAGIGLGLVLLAAFVVMGRGLGASGGFGSLASAGVAAAAPEHARANPVFARFVDGMGDAEGPLGDWVVFELLGVTLGGMLSALLAGRFRIAVERGPRAGAAPRMAFAFGGGALMGLGAAFARGCTSGQALTGGALLSVGSWIFIGAAFLAGYAAAPLFRRQWT